MTGPNRKDYPWRRNRRRLFVVFGFLGAVAVALAVVYGRAESTLQGEVAAIRAKGEPVTPRELRERYPEPPKASDAVETFNKSFSTTTRELNVDGVFLKGRPDKLREASGKDLFAGEFRKWAEGCLAENAEALALLHQAAGKPAARYPINLDGRWWSAGIPDLTKIRNAATLLQLEAVLAAQDGDTARAIGAVLAGLAVGNTLRDSALPILLETRLACYDTTCAGIRQILSTANFSDDQLGQMQHALDAADDEGALTRALMGERALTLVHFDHPEYRFADIRQFNEWVPGGGAMAAALLRVAGSPGRYLSLMGQAIDASGRASWEALPLLREMAVRENGNHAREFGFSVSMMLYFAFQGEQHLMDNAVQVRSAQTALAVERHRLANGQTPENAGLLVPAFLPTVPTDPYDGRPLRYKPVEGGYIAYSVGENQRDDGGADKAGRNLDVVFRVAYPLNQE